MQSDRRGTRAVWMPEINPDRKRIWPCAMELSRSPRSTSAHEESFRGTSGTWPVRHSALTSILGVCGLGVQLELAELRISVLD